MDSLVTSLGWYLVFVFSTCLHEAAHAFVAWKLGDPTAYHGGQVTLNPAPHIRREPVGMVVIPWLSMLLSGYMIGWASAPYDPIWASRYPKRSAWMALAGPASNLSLVLLSALFIRLGMSANWFQLELGGFMGLVGATQPGPLDALASMLSLFFSLNLLLCLFNLIPFPPLDGSGVIPLFLSDRAAARYMDSIRRPGLWMIGLLVAWHFFPQVFGPVYYFVVKSLFL